MIRDQLAKSIVEVAGDLSPPEHKRIHYPPHHAVIREEKRMKLRIVYDVSARSTGYLLNDACRIWSENEHYVEVPPPEGGIDGRHIESLSDDYCGSRR